MNAIQYFDWGGISQPSIGSVTLLGKGDRKNFIVEVGE